MSQFIIEGRVFFQQLSNRHFTLSQFFFAVGVPGTGFFNNPMSNSQIDDITLFGKCPLPNKRSTSVILKGGRDFVFYNFHPGAPANNVGPAF